MQENLPALWAHQKSAIIRSQSEPNLALFWEVGTGKTRATIDMLRHRCAAEGRLLRTVVMCPKIVITNWAREIAKYSRIPERHVIKLVGPGAKRAQKLREELIVDHFFVSPRVIICNYETMEMKDVVEILEAWKPEVIIADEAHRLRKHDGKRAKQVIRLGDIARYRYALTGSPILNSAMDIFNVFRFLDSGRTFGTHFFKFRNIWFEDENAAWSGKPDHFAKWVPRPETYEEFNKLIYNHAIRAVKAECLDLPPFVRKDVFVELGVEQARMYKEMKAEYIAYVDDIKKTDNPRAVVAQMAVTKALRLMQIVTGYAKDEDGTIHKLKDNPRLKALAELLADLAPSHKIIVWSVFHENYDDIATLCQELKINYTELHGRVAQKDRDKNIDAFNNDPQVRVLIANQAAGGIGINLVPSDISIFYSKNFSLEQDIQAEGRNYRGGSEQHKKVTRIDIVCPDTIDDLINNALASKQEVATKILDWR